MHVAEIIILSIFALIFLFFAKGADIDAGLRTSPVNITANAGHLEVVNFFVNEGAYLEGALEDLPRGKCYDYLVEQGGNIEVTGI